ncbi:MAG: hypothetical protein JO020_20750 [Chloroflexi bacterium]|nr:hypothetical protein [Chloroflexota bacterium]MBV9896603.1 hypothetical protein [Chloroflexota bacterium]
MSHLDSSTSQLLAEGITATSGGFVVVPAHTQDVYDNYFEPSETWSNFRDQRK